MLDQILARTARQVELDPAAFATPPPSERVPAASGGDLAGGAAGPAQGATVPTRARAPQLESRLRNLARHAALYRRDTGIDGLYLGFPFLLLALPGEDIKPRISPVLLWPIRLEAEVGRAGRIRLGFDPEREEVRLNPALEGYLGPGVAERWGEAVETALGAWSRASIALTGHCMPRTPRAAAATDSWWASWWHWRPRTDLPSPHSPCAGWWGCSITRAWLLHHGARLRDLDPRQRANLARWVTLFRAEPEQTSSALLQRQAFDQLAGKARHLASQRPDPVALGKVQAMSGAALADANALAEAATRAVGLLGRLNPLRAVRRGRLRGLLRTLGLPESDGGMIELRAAAACELDLRGHWPASMHCTRSSTHWPRCRSRG